MNRIEIMGIAAFIVITAAVLLSQQEVVPLVAIQPSNGSMTYDLNPTFTWAGKADLLMIDENPKFTSPIVINVSGKNRYWMEDSLEIGKHYWKLVGKQETPVMEFEIQGVAGLSVEQDGNGTLLKNSGNVDLDVAIEKGIGGITGAVLVPVANSRLLPGLHPESVEGREHEG